MGFSFGCSRPELLLRVGVTRFGRRLTRLVSSVMGSDRTVHMRTFARNSLLDKVGYGLPSCPELNRAV